MKFSIKCLRKGHEWLPWSFNGARSRRFCSVCDRKQVVAGKDLRE